MHKEIHVQSTLMRSIKKDKPDNKTHTIQTRQKDITQQYIHSILYYNQRTPGCSALKTGMVYGGLMASQLPLLKHPNSDEHDRKMCLN